MTQTQTKGADTLPTLASVNDSVKVAVLKSDGSLAYVPMSEIRRSVLCDNTANVPIPSLTLTNNTDVAFFKDWIVNFVSTHRVGDLFRAAPKNWTFSFADDEATVQGGGAEWCFTLASKVYVNSKWYFTVVGTSYMGGYSLVLRNVAGTWYKEKIVYTTF